MCANPGMEKILAAIEFYLQQFKTEVVSDIIKAISQALPVSKIPDDEITWLSPEQTRNLIGLKSRNSMKKLRESGKVHYAKIGREFRYERKSLLNYIREKSTMRYSITRNLKSNSPLRKAK